MADGTLTSAAPTTPTPWVSSPSGKLRVVLSFGAGSVDLEEQMPDGTAVKIETGITATYSKVHDSIPNVPVRFTPTAVSSTIKWAIQPGGK